MVQETAAERAVRPAVFRDPGSNPPSPPAPSANARAPGTWRARAAAAWDRPAMRRLRERRDAESGGGKQSAAGLESGRRGRAPAHPPRSAGCHRPAPPARARRREPRIPSSILRRSLYPAGPSLSSVGETEALVPATRSPAGARECVPPGSAFPRAGTSPASLFIKQPLGERPVNAAL